MTEQLMEATIHVFDEKHQYIVENYTTSDISYEAHEVGTLNLLNIVTNQKESYSIWCGDDEGSYFYVCLPTGGDEDDEDDNLDVYNLDEFDISFVLSEFQAAI